jgi:regulatory protein
MRAVRGKPLVSIRASAVRMLARRELSRAELQRRLVARGGAPDEVVQTLDDLERAGYLSDARYAQAIVAQRSGRYGKRLIARNLAEKGVAPEAAQEALAALADTDELSAAIALWRRKFGSPPVDDRERARQVRFLVSRGFCSATAYRVLHAGGSGADDDDAR